MKVEFSGNKSSWLNYHHLYYFMVIATEGSIANASKKLRVGQPALSAQLKQFEDSLGVQLFQREHRRLTLTDTGVKVLDYAKEIFRIGNELVQNLNDNQTANRTHVQIGALDSVPKTVIGAVVQTALELNQCAVSVLEGGFDELLRELAQHKIDIILSNHVPTTAESNHFYMKRISRENVVICGAKPFAALRKNFPDSLKNSRFVLPTFHSRLRFDLDHYFKVKELNVDLLVESQDSALLKMLAVNAVGLVALPESVAESYLKNKTLFEIGPVEGVYEELFLISNDRKIQNPVAASLMKHFKI